MRKTDQLEDRSQNQNAFHFKLLRTSWLLYSKLISRLYGLQGILKASVQQGAWGAGGCYKDQILLTLSPM